MEVRKRIKYFCVYGFPDAEHKRDQALSAVNKIDYIVSALNRAGIAADIVSMAECTEKRAVIARGEVIRKGENTVRLFTSFGLHHIKPLRKIFRFILKIEFILWILFNVRKGEEIIVYHYMGYARIFTNFCKLKSLRIIGEVEEIYQDVRRYSASQKKSEYAFFGSCAKFIFPVSLLREKINGKGLPDTVVHGIYRPEESRNVSFNDGKIHVVYAGTFKQHKGVDLAIEAASRLPRKYTVHVLGFGSAEDIERVKAGIADADAVSESSIRFEGTLTGEDFIRFIQKCHIGLCTQDPSADYNTTSFPSKILTYISNGLSVVSVETAAIKNSAIAGCIHFYTVPDAGNVADAITGTEISDQESEKNRKIISELDGQFIHSLRRLLDTDK